MNNNPVEDFCLKKTTLNMPSSDEPISDLVACLQVMNGNTLMIKSLEQEIMKLFPQH